MPSELSRNKHKTVKFNSEPHKISECPHEIKGKYIHYKPPHASEGKEMVRMINGDGLRELIVPNQEVLEPPAIWSLSEFNRLQSQARILTEKDKQRLTQDAEKKKAELQKESEKRRELLQKAQLGQLAKPGSKLYKNESDAADKHSYVLQRAFELRQEQEDEVKNANGIILAAKCLAVRQAQIAERSLIQKELDHEERRLDMMMEQERQKALRAEEVRKLERKKIDERQVREVSQQIYENEVQKLIEVEKKEEESRCINKALIAMQREDAERLRKKKLQHFKTREELRLANENIAHFKIRQKEEERIANLRIQEFMRKKAEREAAQDAELAAAKAEKDREIARLQAQQQHAMDQQSMNDELNALRVQEEVERAWRDKEKAAATKRKQQQEDIKKARERQMEDLRKTHALEIQRDQEEFYRIAKVQKELFQKDLDKRRQQKEAALKHRKDLLQQINEKERQRLITLKQKFEEGASLTLEQEVRSLNIQSVLRKKVTRLRENKVPENFVKDIERQLKLI